MWNPLSVFYWCPLRVIASLSLSLSLCLCVQPQRNVRITNCTEKIYFEEANKGPQLNMKFPHFAVSTVHFVQSVIHTNFCTTYIYILVI